MPEDQNGQEVLEDVQTQDQGEEAPEELSTSEEPTDAPVEGELPEDTKERTRREFEKLKEHNRQLAEENKKLKGSSQPVPSVLEYLAPPTMPQYVPQVQPQYQPQVAPQPQLVDENGYVNTEVLQSELAEAKKAREKAEAAERRALEAENRISRFEQDAETKKVYAAYPELDPLSEVFDPKAYQMVRDRLTSQIVSTGTRDAMKAAEEMSEYFRKAPPANLKAQEQRRQAALPGTTQRVPSVNVDELIAKSRTSDEAMAERLARWEQANAQ